MTRTGGGSQGGFGSLRLLQPGETGWVTSLTAEGLVRRRLLDLGFVPGTAVQGVRRSPFGDPTAYMVRGSIIALRGEDADRIIVGLVGGSVQSADQAARPDWSRR